MDGSPPDPLGRDYALVAAAIGHLDEHRVRQPRISEVAAALHVSTGHLHRSFTRFAGVSPHRFLRWLTFGAARQLLRERASVLEVTAATGLSTPSRLYDLSIDLVGMTPGQVADGGAGLELRMGVHPTLLGPASITVAPRGVVDLRFLEPRGEVRGDLDGPIELPGPDGGPEAAAAAARAQMARRWPGAQVIVDPEATRWVADHLAAVLGDETLHPRTALPVLATGTNLQLRVWEALLRVPADRVVTYAEVARAAGHPTAVRAVASAVGRNPVALLIPCHRVLRSTGELGGYRWGTTRKRALLAREAARAEEVVGADGMVAAEEVVDTHGATR
ncbi:MAG: methylated-DNA--[protein]-cysteine S-methyltransferase [Nitriliruptoraceae bacterium]